MTYQLDKVTDRQIREFFYKLDTTQEGLLYFLTVKEFFKENGIQFDQARADEVSKHLKLHNTEGRVNEQEFVEIFHYICPQYCIDEAEQKEIFETRRNLEMLNSGNKTTQLTESQKKKIEDYKKYMTQSLSRFQNQTIANRNIDNMQMFQSSKYENLFYTQPTTNWKVQLLREQYQVELNKLAVIHKKFRLKDFKYYTERVLEDIFMHIDKNSDGYVSPGELICFLEQEKQKFTHSSIFRALKQMAIPEGYNMNLQQFKEVFAQTFPEKMRYF